MVTPIYFSSFFACVFKRKKMKKISHKNRLLFLKIIFLSSSIPFCESEAIYWKFYLSCPKVCINCFRFSDKILLSLFLCSSVFLMVKLWSLVITKGLFSTIVVDLISANDFFHLPRNKLYCAPPDRHCVSTR